MECPHPNLDQVNFDTRIRNKQVLIDCVFGATILPSSRAIAKAVAADEAAACIKIPSQAATAPRKQHLLSKPSRWGCFRTHWGQRHRFNRITANGAYVCANQACQSALCTRQFRPCVLVSIYRCSRRGWVAWDIVKHLTIYTHRLHM